MELKELIEKCIHINGPICLVGAGGKTSLMYHIADAAAKRGKKVLVTTTTHIFLPEKNYAQSIEEARLLWEKGEYAVIGRGEKEKLTFPTDQLYHALREEADVILIEADGSKGMPCKVPASHEPVILPDCQLVIGLLGMSALEKSCKDVCFRYDTDGQWLEDAILDENTAVRLLTSEKGTRKSVGDREYIVVLNQCDRDVILEKARRISRELSLQYQIQAVCSSLKS